MALALGLGLGPMTTGCTGLTPQLHPTDIAALEQLEDRDEREQAYIDNAIVPIKDARGVRYTKGQRLGARSRNWQSLDLILRSDRNSAAALPEKKLRVARVLTGFMIASSLVTIGGISASAREGLDLTRPTGTSAVLIGGAVGMLAFGIASGVVWGQAKSGYENAVNVYNDSLALRLGISDADGEYRPPPGVLVDEDGFIILDQRELSSPDLRPKPPPPAGPVEIEIEAQAPAPVVPEGEPAEPGAEPSRDEPSGGSEDATQTQESPGAASAASPAESAGSPATRPTTPAGGLVGPSRS